MEMAREGYAEHGRGALVVRIEDLDELNKNSSDHEIIRAFYNTLADIERMPPSEFTIGLKAQVESYDVNQMYILIVVSKERGCYSCRMLMPRCIRSMITGVIVMTTNHHVPTPDECFASVLFDELLKDAHCIDSPEAWDADPTRPYQFKEILDFMFEDSKNDKPKIFRMLSDEVQLSASRVHCVICEYSSQHFAGSCRIKMSSSYPHLNYFTKLSFLAHGLSRHKSEVLLRSITLYLSILRGEWPPEYVGLSRKFTYKLKDSE